MYVLFYCKKRKKSFCKVKLLRFKNTQIDVRKTQDTSNDKDLVP